MSENDNLVAGLLRKRAELAGLIQGKQIELRQLVIDIDNVDATLRIFRPDIDLEVVKPKPLPPRHTAFKGEMAMLVLGALRQTGAALSTKDITHRVMSDRGLNTADLRLVQTISKRVGACLKHYRNNGLLVSREVSGKRGRFMMWEVASAIKK